MYIHFVFNFGMMFITIESFSLSLVSVTLTFLCDYGHYIIL